MPLRRRWLARAGWVAVCVLIGSIVLQRTGAPGAREDDWRRFDRRSFVVQSVLSGDTIRVGSADTSQVVRLLGVYAPRPAADGSSSDEYFAERSRAYLRARCEGQSVLLRLDEPQTRDHRGTLLAYVYSSDTDMLNQDIIRDGQGYADRRMKHTFSPQFEMTENEARKRKRGLWKELTAEQMPQWRTQWLRSLQQRN